jgi:hypothetical protein
MRQFNSNVFSSFPILEKQCQFNRSCKIYSKSSYTCTHTGGTYCGKYRALSQNTIKEKGSNQNIIDAKAMLT